MTRWYHCIYRFTRTVFLLAEGNEDRKQWVEDRIEKLVNSFALSVGGFAILDRHRHVLSRLDPDAAQGWSDEEVVRRWIAVYPPQTRNVLGGSIQKHRHLGYRSKAVGGIEQDHWLEPVEDRRVREPESREGMLETFSLGSYLMLVEYTGRLVRNGKARMNTTVKDVFTRLETNAGQTKVSDKQRCQESLR